MVRDWGKGEKALGAFDSALSLDTAYVHAYHLRGLCRHGMGDHKGAQADFVKGLFYDGQVCALLTCGVCDFASRPKFINESSLAYVSSYLRRCSRLQKC